MSLSDRDDDKVKTKSPDDEEDLVVDHVQAQDAQGILPLLMSSSSKSEEA